MLRPVEEYYGKGRPLSKIIAAFDIDSDFHQHIIGIEGYCTECIRNSEEKAKIFSDILNDMGINFIKIYSGKKGFHFYLLEDDKELVKEITEKDLINLLSQFNIKDLVKLVDNINFFSKSGTYDLHRIFSLPNTVDASTGIILKNNFEKLNFMDILEEYG